MFFFNDTATTDIYTLSLHDALPISSHQAVREVLDSERRGHEPVYLTQTALRVLSVGGQVHRVIAHPASDDVHRDRKSTRLNSSHANISYAVFCLKKRKADDGDLIAL